MAKFKLLPTKRKTPTEASVKQKKPRKHEELDMQLKIGEDLRSKGHFFVNTMVGSYRCPLHLASNNNFYINGTPDMFWACARSKYKGVFMEFKNGKKGKISNEQQATLNRLNADGYLATFIHSYEHYQKFYNRYINLKTEVSHPHGSNDSEKQRKRNTEKNKKERF